MQINHLFLPFISISYDFGPVFVNLLLNKTFPVIQWLLISSKISQKGPILKRLAFGQFCHIRLRFIIRFNSLLIKYFEIVKKDLLIIILRSNRLNLVIILRRRRGLHAECFFGIVGDSFQSMLPPIIWHWRLFALYCYICLIQELIFSGGIGGDLLLAIASFYNCADPINKPFYQFFRKWVNLAVYDCKREERCHAGDYHRRMLLNLVFLS